MKIHNVNVDATAIGLYTDGGLFGDLERAGLVIGSDSIEFPDSILDSVTWAVGWRHEITDPGDGFGVTDGEILEHEELGRLLDRLYRAGGKQELAPEFNN